MIELQKVRFKNLFSYGEEVTELQLGDMGICLVRGEIDDNNTKNLVKSNGSGKSSLLNSILWCLSGRTMHSDNPKVFNWFTDGNAWGQLEFKNGAVLTREKARSGGMSVSLELPNLSYDSTLSTTTNEQSRINRELMFDWDLFCGSVFFAQFGQPWLNMADQTRKKTIERILHIDRFSTYSDVSKSKINLATSDQNILKEKIRDINKTIQAAQADLNEAQESKNNWVDTSEKERDIYLKQAQEYLEQREAVVLEDMQVLQAKWDKVKLVEAKIDKIEADRRTIERALFSCQSKLDAKIDYIKSWEKKSGKVCDKCNQEVDCTHVDNQVSSHRKVRDDLQTEIADLESKIKASDALIVQIKARVEQSKPAITLDAAQKAVREWQRYDRLHQEALENRKNVQAEENPFVRQCAKLVARIGTLQASLKELEVSIGEADILVNHYNYIQKSYSDRKKIKSFVISDYLPYFNSRLEYYLNAFELDIKLRLSESLSIESSHWEYNYESGGEKMRSNVAFTFAIYDLHEELYGKQCNILVLDEVDGALDPHGVNSLIELIRNDLSKKVESIFIISHKHDMNNVFPREILISRDANRVSRIKEIR